MKTSLLIILLLISLSAWSGIELRMDLPDQVRAGEIFSVKAEIISIEGATQLASLRGQTLQETLYINKVGVIEKNSQESNGSVELGIVFLKPFERMPLATSDGNIKIYLSSVKVIPSEEAKDFILINWKLPFNLPWWSYLILVVMLITGLALYKAYPKWQKKKKLKELKTRLWNRLISASSEKEIMDIWHEKLTYFSHFPDIESNFRSWEKTINPFFFKKELSSDEKVKIQKSYQKFVSELPVRRGHGV